MKIFLLLLILLSNTFFSFSQNKDEQAIRNIIAAQAQQWNQGSIDGYMSGYWQNDSLIFVGGKTCSYGYTTISNNYTKAYPDTAQMGKLALTILNIKRLSSKYYYIIGQWHLQRTIGDVGGHYTLLLQKINHKWKIIVDHT